MNRKFTGITKYLYYNKKTDPGYIFNKNYSYF